MFYEIVFSIKLGGKVAEALTVLFNNGLRKEGLHLIGFSIGAPLAAEISRSLGGTIPRFVYIKKKKFS